MAVNSPRPPREITGEFHVVSRTTVPAMATVQIGSHRFELPVAAVPRIPNGSVLTLSLSPTGQPDMWQFPKRSVRKLLGVDVKDLDAYRLAHPTDPLTMESLLDATLSLPVLAHRSVVAMLHQPLHRTSYENLLQYPCTDQSQARNKQRQDILANPVLSAFVHRFAWPTMHLLLHFRYGLETPQAHRLLHVLNFSAAWVTKYPYLTAYALDGSHTEFTYLDAIADAHQKTASAPDRIHAAVFWAVQRKVFGQKHITFSVEQLKIEASHKLQAYGQAYPTTLLGRVVASSGGFHVAVNQAWEDLVATEYVHAWKNEQGKELAYIRRVYFSVRKSGKFLARLTQAPPMTPLVDPVGLAQRLTLAPYNLDATQLRLVQHILTRRLTIVTGGPGRGKTHVIASLVHALGQVSQPPTVWVIAPTARAAVRARQATLQLAKAVTPPGQALLATEFLTAHKALNMTPTMDGSGTASLPELVIVDEVSMIDAIVAHELFKSVLAGRTRLVLVGDSAQLPPVGIGQVFRGLLKETLNQRGSLVHALTQSYRVSANPITPALEALQRVIALHDGLSGNVAFASLPSKQRKDRIQQDTTLALDLLRQASTVQWDKAVTAKSLDKRLKGAVRDAQKRMPDGDILVLTPYRHAKELNAYNLNHTMHDLLHQGPTLMPGEPLLIRENGTYAEHQGIRNVYIPNGTLGVVQSATPDIVVATVTDPDDIAQNITIELSMGGFGTIFDWGYVTTVHAAQGGQAPTVILVGSPSDAPKHPEMSVKWELHMLYTALSRVQDLSPNQLGHVVILGELEMELERPDRGTRPFTKGWAEGMQSGNGANP